MGAIGDLCTTLGEHARQRLSGEDLMSGDGQLPGFYEACLQYLASLSEVERSALYEACVRDFAGCLRSGNAQYRQWLVGEHEGHFVHLMLWVPGALTRPHNHMGSPARIRVLCGALEQRHYDIGAECGDFTPHILGTCAAGEEIEEDAQNVHAIHNPSSFISMSLHDFFGNEGMRVYDLFGSKKKWVANPGETSKPGVPVDAAPIWTNEGLGAYRRSGVDYGAMDLFKRMAQLAARETAGNLTRFGFREIEESRGESAYLLETPWGILAHVEEGLGTKNLIAEATRRLAIAEQVSRLVGRSFYDNVAQDTVAMIVNDMATVGALPISVCMHLAAGSSDWFKDEGRLADLVRGWVRACHLARCVWGGGETPTLRDVVFPDTAVLAGSAVGIITPKKRMLHGSKIREGDAIVFLGSSGPHANGLTLARDIADKLPNGYLTEIAPGQTYGEALLAPTTIYVPVVEDCLDEGVDIRYAVNITGHGWRKLMRAVEPFTYVIDKVPEPQPVFQVIADHVGSDEEMYGNYNMGAGFALFVPESDVPRLLAIVAVQHGINCMRAGYVERDGEMKRVLIRPKNLTYGAETLGVR